MKTLFSILLACFVSLLNINAQKAPAKLGNPPDSDFKDVTCPIDSTASAYYIFDYGSTYFDYNLNTGWKLNMKRHFKIKIVTKEGYSHADIPIMLYNSNTSKEIVSGIKAYTYNVVNGKVVKTSLEKGNIVREKMSERNELVKISMPSIREGSVIEVSYTIESDFWPYMRDWNFQHKIPVLYSEFLLGIPQYFNYSVFMRGYEILEKSEKNSSFGTISNEGESVTYTVENRHMIARNLPALKSEEYVTTMENYRSGLEFELSSIHWPDKIPINFSNDWNAVTEYMINHSNYGSKLSKMIFIRKDIEGIIDENPEPESRMIAIYKYVQEKIKCTGKYGMFSNTSLMDVYKKGLGSVTDINFILINLLKVADINAYPVALSTRENGFIFPVFPTVDKFNYTVALAVIGDKQVFLDASNPNCSPGVLPSCCLNGQGRIIDVMKNQWVELPVNIPYTETCEYELNLDDHGNMNGSISYTLDGYAAIGFRTRDENLLNEDKIAEKMTTDRPGMVVNSYEFKGLNEKQGNVITKFDVSLTSSCDVMGDIISFSPLFYEAIRENPFKLEERKFPVDFNYPLNYVRSFKITIPEGYKIESMPKDASYVIPDKSGKFTFTAINFGDKIYITVITEIKKMLYLPTEYGIIKEFYNIMVAKQAEKVILKKV